MESISGRQFLFLKAFMRACKKNKKTDKLLRHFNREKIDSRQYLELMEKYPCLYPAAPYNRKGDGDDIVSEVEFIEFYNKKTGIHDYIEKHDPNRYGISQEGLRAITDFRIRFFSQIGFPLLSLIVSVAAIIVSIIALTN